MPAESELRALLQSPAENLSVEYKSWLDLAETPAWATLAKAAIAIANEGGGVVVFGMREDAADGSALRSVPRPAGINRYSQDEINASIRRFADPEFHCGLMFAVHPATGHEHAFVIVPGGMTVPVMSRRGCDGVIAAGFEPATHSLEVFGNFNDFKAHSDKFLLRTWLEVALLFLFVGMTSASVARSG